MTRSTRPPRLLRLEDRTVPAVAFATLTGIHSVGSSRLIRFDTANPGAIQLDVSVTGVAVDEFIRGLDFRPSTGQLYGLGDRITSGSHEYRLYRIDPQTGAATKV